MDRHGSSETQTDSEKYRPVLCGYVFSGEAGSAHSRGKEKLPETQERPRERKGVPPSRGSRALGARTHKMEEGQMKFEAM